MNLRFDLLFADFNLLSVGDSFEHQRRPDVAHRSVALAGARLDAQRGAFFARLVRAWQLAVYGGRLPDTEKARALCQEFDVHLALQARPGGTA